MSETNRVEQLLSPALRDDSEDLRNHAAAGRLGQIGAEAVPKLDRFIPGR